MGFFSRFFSDEPGAADAPIIVDNGTNNLPYEALNNFAMTLMETGKI